VIKYIIILIVILGISPLSTAWAKDCEGEGQLFITSPREGDYTLNSGVSVRGYLCSNYQFVLIKNRTTESATLTDTMETCDQDGCVYTFSAFVRGLALGANELTASIPGQEDENSIEASVEVIRTALAMLEK
jgi:hypothetical protein